MDDHADTNRMLSALLGRLGFRAVSAPSGEAALALLDAEHPDLVICDVMMPGMDGVEVLRTVRSNPATAQLPVILFSAISAPEFIEHVTQKGASDYWVKGNMNYAHLKESVQKYL